MWVGGGERGFLCLEDVEARPAGPGRSPADDDDDDVSSNPRVRI